MREPARLPPPDLSEAPQIELRSWDVFTSGERMLVGACFSGKSGAWLPEADEIAMQKLSSMTLSTTLRAGHETTMQPLEIAREGPVRTQKLEGDGMHAKTMLGFESNSAVDGCFALCIKGDSACRSAVDAARLEGALVEPPPPSFSMRVLSHAVHHPSQALLAIVAVCVLGAAFVVLTRPRPKIRPKS